MNIYYFNALGELVGYGQRPIDPVATELAGEPVYATVNEAFGTLEAPPAFNLATERAIHTPSIGWTIESIPTPEPEPEPEPEVSTVPSQLTMRQARLSLLSAGLLAGVDQAIAALPSPKREAAQIEWDYSATVERNSALVALLGASLGLDGPALDAMFTSASTL